MDAGEEKAGEGTGKAGEGSQPQATLLESAKAPDAAGTKPGEDGNAGGEGAAGADGQGKAEGAGAPADGYKFTLPGGKEFDKETLSAFTAIAKEANLSQEAGQKLVDLQLGMYQKAQDQSEKDYQGQRKQWQDETKAAFGKDFDKELGLAAKARDAFVTPELSELFKLTGLGDHPEINKLMAAIGKAIGEDKIVIGKGGKGDDMSGMTAEQRLAARHRANEKK